jgi:hypothetical protein
MQIVEGLALDGPGAAADRAENPAWQHGAHISAGIVGGEQGPEAADYLHSIHVALGGDVGLCHNIGSEVGVDVGGIGADIVDAARWRGACARVTHATEFGAPRSLASISQSTSCAGLAQIA